MKNLIIALIQKITTWWNTLSDESAFAIWWLIWYIPLFLAALLDTAVLWIIFLVVFAICIVWFIADTAIDYYKTELKISRENFRKATRATMEEVNHYAVTQRRDDRDQ